MQNQKANKKIARAPVVVIMGHIDHGKSTLLDYIRKSNVVAGEAGGITQHISAYEVIHKTKENVERSITFLDTPGHEAFAQMRSRGANVADVAILIVSAEDGVKTQTLEALSAIQEAKIPFIVAINKIDKPNANIERTKANLVEKEIYLEGNGGDIPWVAISAKTGEGIPELLDVLLLVTDIAELSGDRDKHAEGVVIESNIDTKKGISATLIIKDGTLASGSFVVVADCIAPVRIMENFLGAAIKEASFSSPVNLIGFNCIPQVGSLFVSFKTKKEAESAVGEYKEMIQAVKKPSVAQGTDVEAEEVMPTIPVIIKADVLGTIDAIEHEIRKIKSDRIEIKIIQKGAGAISENDVKSVGGKGNAIIVGFNVGVDGNAKELAERAGIEIHTFNIIYELAQWLKDAVETRTPKMNVDEVTGRAKILKVFSRAKDKQILGARVEEGTIAVSEVIRIIRKDQHIGQGKILGLQSQKAKTSRVTAGTECGSQIQSNIEILPGDIVESFTVVEK